LVSSFFDLLQTGLIWWAGYYIVYNLLRFIFEFYRHYANQKDISRAMSMGYEITRMPKHNELQNKLTVIDIEKRDGQFYAYNYVTSSFVSQGTTLSELFDAIEDRLRTNTFTLSQQTTERLSADIAKISKEKGTEEQT
jgi:hypothetical protein|tara:strand:- start:874 stop:1287 length:414 start_codon:yes stop_codon:yes gene_type:complete